MCLKSSFILKFKWKLYFSPFQAANVQQVLTEIKASNQMAQFLGNKVEMAITKAVEGNKTLQRVGLHFEFGDCRWEINSNFSCSLSFYSPLFNMICNKFFLTDIIKKSKCHFLVSKFVHGQLHQKSFQGVLYNFDLMISG